ncbi:MAG: 4-hydroxy-3-methylbut-2-enyl diphosphate reductase [Bacteroidales bacterium]
MKISIEERSGFCFGVKRAIEMAEEILDKGEIVYCLGEIVHNEIEVKRLTDKGLIFIEHSDLENLRDKKVLIRAHGEPPKTYQLAEINNLTIIDGTCPIVLALQKKVKNSYLSMNKEKGQILIYGKIGHPEVTGLLGQTGDDAWVVRNHQELSSIPKGKDLYLFSQTTMDTRGFEEMDKYLRELKQSGKVNNLEVNNTICKHISHREPGLRRFALTNDVIIFISGITSSNGRILYEICKSENPETYFISDPDELKPGWFKEASSVGISGATSTPRWLLEQVADTIKDFTKT